MPQLAGNYRWSIARSDPAANYESYGAADVAAWTIADSSDGPLHTSAYAGGVVSASVAVFSSRWIITLEPRTGWMPRVWLSGAIAGVVALAGLLTTLTLLLTIEHNLKEELIYLMLPRRIVAKMRAGKTNLAEPFPHATVLFTDIVSYTELAQATAPPASRSARRSRASGSLTCAKPRI